MSKRAKNTVQPDKGRLSSKNCLDRLSCCPSKCFSPKDCCKKVVPWLLEILLLSICLILVTNIFIGVLQFYQNIGPGTTVFDKRFGPEFGQKLAEWNQIKMMAGCINIGIGLVGFLAIVLDYVFRMKYTNGTATKYFFLIAAIIIAIMAGTAIALDLLGIISNDMIQSNNLINRINWMSLMTIMVVLLCLIIYSKIFSLCTRKKTTNESAENVENSAFRRKYSTPESSSQVHSSQEQKQYSTITGTSPQKRPESTMKFSDSEIPSLPEPPKLEKKDSTTEPNSQKPPEEDEKKTDSTPEQNTPKPPEQNKKNPGPCSQKPTEEEKKKTNPEEESSHDSVEPIPRTKKKTSVTPDQTDNNITEKQEKIDLSIDRIDQTKPPINDSI